MSGIESALAALYLRGIARPTEPHPRLWPEILSLLRRHGGDGDHPGILRSSGFSAEAAVLESRAYGQAERMVQSGLALTVGSPIYPRRWVEHLGPGAPPALYVRGDISLLQVKSFAAVGSRQPPTTALRAAIDITFLAQELGYMPTSGGAPGIDRTISSAGSYIEIWPCGLGIRWGAYKRAAHSSLQMSLWPPREQFSTAAAMERNALVYAISDAAFVAHARFRQGGTWHGATDALRKRLTRIVVGSSEWPKEDEAARKALLGLGAQPLNSFTPEGLSTAIEAEPLQPWLPTFAPESTSERALGAY